MEKSSPTPLAPSESFLSHILRRGQNRAVGCENPSVVVVHNVFAVGFAVSIGLRSRGFEGGGEVRGRGRHGEGVTVVGVGVGVGVVVVLG